MSAMKRAPMLAQEACSGTSLPTLRVLLVEDEFLIAMDAAAILKEMGMVVVGPFLTLEDGLAAVERETFDVAMIDINLRGEKSYPIAELLSWREIPFFFATGYDVPNWSGTAPKVGKPYRDDEICEVLRELSGS